MSATDLIVVGSSPLSLACVHRAATHGLAVTWIRTGEVFARSTVGALLPFPLAIGSGITIDDALRSRGAWLAIAMELETWHRRTGSLLFAFTPEDRTTLETFLEASDDAIVFCEWVEADELLARLPVWKGAGDVLGALFSSAEVVLDPAEFEQRVRGLLVERHGVIAVDGVDVRDASGRSVRTSDGRTFESDRVILDEDVLHTTFPRHDAGRVARGFARTAAQGGTWHLEPLPVLTPCVPVAEQLLLVEDRSQALLAGAPTPLPPPDSSLLEAIDPRARHLDLPMDRIVESWTASVSTATTFHAETQTDGLTVIHAAGEGAFTLAFAHAERLLAL